MFQARACLKLLVVCGCSFASCSCSQLCRSVLKLHLTHTSVRITVARTTTAKSRKIKTTQVRPLLVRLCHSCTSESAFSNGIQLLQSSDASVLTQVECCQLQLQPSNGKSAKIYALIHDAANLRGICHVTPSIC